jgi:hypothetical protein
MNAAGYEFLRKHDWRELTKRHTFTTTFSVTTGDVVENLYTITNIPSTAGLDTTYQVVGNGISNAAYIESVDSATQVTINLPATGTYTGTSITFEKVQYPLPSDYESTVPRTHWDLSKHWEMLGPESPQQWEWLLSGFIATGPRIRWRLLGKYFQIWPGVSTNELLGYEYRSKGWALSSTNVVKDSFTADTDTCIYPDRLMVLATKLKYFEAKGFDTTAMYRNYIEEFEIVRAQDMSAANLSFAPRPGTVLIGYDNIPDTGYGTN